MKKIMLLNNISDKGTVIFKDRFQTVEKLEDADLVIVRSGKMHELKTDHLLGIARAGAGTNNIPSDRCAAEGVVVFNTPGSNANAVKELVLCAMLMSGRDVIGSIEWASTLKGKGDEVLPLVEKNKSAFTGREVMEKKLGVIGAGAIGGMVANVAIALGMEAIVYDPFLSAEAKEKLLPEVEITESIDDIYAQSDFITIHVPLNDSTRNLIGKDSIPKLRKDVVIMNFARDGLVENDAIIKALEEGHVSKYITDFPEDEILGVKNVIAIPHLGASTPEAEENSAVMAVNQLIEFVENGNIINSVNYPNIKMGKKQGQRILVLFEGTEQDADKLLDKIKACGINVSQSKAASRKGFGALLAEAAKIDEAVVKTLENMDTVKRVRLI